MSMDYRFDHPERLDGEVFLGNFTEDDFTHVGWKTKRLGREAYDITGRNVRHYGLRPGFAMVSETGFSRKSF